MVSKLFVRDFRCFSNLEIEFHPESTCIIGRNASGKTSLLEAVAVLTRLQSPRTNSLAQLVRLGRQGSGHRRLRLGLSSSVLLQREPTEARSGCGCTKEFAYLPRGGEGRLFREFRHRSDSRYAATPADDFSILSAANCSKTIERSCGHMKKHSIHETTILKMMPARPREVSAYRKPLLQFGLQLTALARISARAPGSAGDRIVCAQSAIATKR